MTNHKNTRIATIVAAWNGVCAGIGRDAESAADATDRMAALLRRAGQGAIADAAAEYAESLRGLGDHSDEAIAAHEAAESRFLSLAYPE